ncbi:hypothetical protein B0H16DRAFT_1468914 [Mycena metata]|uniref:Uncharacterized protein n=1 Tax=Mycena metata TaxID=1033252 RepID=A0AAD7MUV7_9AGAR|nr:hypothetical protein B0H16DRAFT_1468914 [Mycena metata]
MSMRSTLKSSVNPDWASFASLARTGEGKLTLRRPDSEAEIQGAALDLYARDMNGAGDVQHKWRRGGANADLDDPILYDARRTHRESLSPALLEDRECRSAHAGLQKKTCGGAQTGYGGLNVRGRGDPQRMEIKARVLISTSALSTDSDANGRQHRRGNNQNSMEYGGDCGVGVNSTHQGFDLNEEDLVPPQSLESMSTSARARRRCGKLQRAEIKQTSISTPSSWQQVGKAAGSHGFPEEERRRPVRLAKVDGDARSGGSPYVRILVCTPRAIWGSRGTRLAFMRRGDIEVVVNRTWREGRGVVANVCHAVDTVRMPRSANVGASDCRTTLCISRRCEREDT